MNLLLGLLIFVLVATPIAAGVALSRARTLVPEVDRLKGEVRGLRNRLKRHERLIAELRDNAVTPGGEAETRTAARTAARAKAAHATPAQVVIAEPEPLPDVVAPASDIPPETDIPPGEATPKKDEAAEAPQQPPLADAFSRDFEALIGTTWLLRIGLGVLAIAIALFARTVVPDLSPLTKVVVAYAGAAGLFGVGKYYEHKLERFAQPVMAAGLSFGFFVAFAAYFVPAMSAVSLTVSIVWMAISMVTVLLAAERWKSEATAVLAILLGHVSAFVSAGDADLYSLILIGLLAVTAISLLLRYKWTVLGVSAVAVSYGSFLLWTLVDRGPGAAGPTFWVSLAFLTSYYVSFLVADLLWWQRGDQGRGDRRGARAERARQLGPTNLVLYVSMTSFLYVSTGMESWAVEWYFLTLGSFQVVLAWLYRRIGHQDYVFYPAFGTALITIGLFANFDALALNLVLAFQAVILLLAAHRTRLWIFHGLAQAALLVAFLNWLAYPTLGISTLPIFLGGLGLAGVYFFESMLEDLWYGQGSAGDWFESAGSGPSHIARSFRDLFTRAAPWIAPFHAALGGVVLVREALRHFGPGTSFALMMAATLCVLVGAVLVRRRVALLFGVSAIAGAQLFVPLPETFDGVLLTVALLASALAVVHLGVRKLPSVSAGKMAWHAQMVAVFALTSAFVTLIERSLPAADYLAWMLVPVLMLLFQERIRRADESSTAAAAENVVEPAQDRGMVGLLASGATAVFVLALTTETLGPVVTAPVWIAGWSAILLATALRVRGTNLFVAANITYWGGLWYFLSEEQQVVEQVLDLWWAGTAATIVGLAFALALDRFTTRLEADREHKHPVQAWATFASYGAAIAGVAFLTDRQFSFGWSLLLPAALGVGLVACSTRFRLARASQMGLAGLIALNLFACTVMLVQVRPMSTPLIVLVLVASMSLLGDRIIPLHGRLRESPESLRTVRLALLGLAATTIMIAIYASTLFGATWATAGWSILAASLMTAGFALKSKRHRFVALAVLGACLVRVFLVDTRALSDTARTVAFLVLGLCLVGAAWLYSRYSEELEEWL